jgi:hypothetical protein
LALLQAQLPNFHMTKARIADGDFEGLFVADIGAYEVEADEFFAGVGA